ncbi:MAG: cyclase family protein [Methylobacteriaceae bacterium]|jgi:kynurenine formamidase|nr:cyclase family protein [Methylobacteriaceae bacterium]
MTTEEILGLLENVELVDLSQTIEEDMPVRIMQPRFYQNNIRDMGKGDVSYSNVLSMGEHLGTHADALSHIVHGALNIDQMDLRTWMGRALVIDVSHLEPCAKVPAELIKEWEGKNIPIKKGDIVCIYTGQDKLWGLRPNHKQFVENWRGLSVPAAEYLRDRGVKTVGTDATDIDANTPTNDLVAHHVLMTAGISIMENLANLSKLMPGPFAFLALPLKIRNGSGSPIRPVALLPR